MITHRDSYRLSDISVVSVRRPFMAPAFMIGGGLSGFGHMFADLLYPGELLGLVIGGLSLVAAGSMAGQLKLLSRDLRGSELIDALWGSYSHLNRIRSQIVAAIRLSRPGAESPVGMGAGS
ncbi:hypothetical protein [Notoacmeibacter marinus]|uniref:hypothetical protein n=1 Tax=Notoacmeibacter marinus TaxID=1876515 RepID=UPI00117AC5CD|nr:hypothetical protein [Notoacmeibacter marinus]